jgi:hypothetical protein
VPRRAHLDEEAVRFAELALVRRLISEHARQLGARFVEVRLPASGTARVDLPLRTG